MISDVAAACRGARRFSWFLGSFLVFGCTGLLLAGVRKGAPEVSFHLAEVIWFSISAVAAVSIWIHTGVKCAANVAAMTSALRTAPSSITRLEEGERTRFGTRAYVNLAGHRGRIALLTYEPEELLARLDARSGDIVPVPRGDTPPYR